MNGVTKNYLKLTSAKQEATHADLSPHSGRTEITLVNAVATPTNPGYSPANDGDTVSLEPFIHSVPDKAGTYYCCSRVRIVGDLGKPPSIDMDPFCRREPGIRCMASALYLKRQGVGGGVTQ